MTDEARSAANRASEAGAAELSEARAGLPGVRARDDVLDEIDKRVIRILQADGRMPNTEIARELRLSETTVRKRISQLVSRGLINIVAVPTPRAVGMNLSAIIGISILLPNLRRSPMNSSASERSGTAASQPGGTTSSLKPSSSISSTSLTSSPTGSAGCKASPASRRRSSSTSSSSPTNGRSHEAQRWCRAR